MVSEASLVIDETAGVVAVRLSNTNNAKMQSPDAGPLIGKLSAGNDVSLAFSLAPVPRRGLFHAMAAGYSLKILLAPLSHATFTSPPFNVTGKPVAVSM